MIVDKINADLKTAMLAGDRQTVDVLKSLKTALQYQRVSKGADSELSEDETIAAIKKEHKKRLDAVEMYKSANQSERMKAELAESKIIENYLPAALSEEEVIKLAEQAISSYENPSIKDMGELISKVKKASNNTADGAIIAKIIRERLV